VTRRDHYHSSYTLLLRIEYPSRSGFIKQIRKSRSHQITTRDVTGSYNRQQAGHSTPSWQSPDRVVHTLTSMYRHWSRSTSPPGKDKRMYGWRVRHGTSPVDVMIMTTIILSLTGMVSEEGQDSRSADLILSLRCMWLWLMGKKLNLPHR